MIEDGDLHEYAVYGDTGNHHLYSHDGEPPASLSLPAEVSDVTLEVVESGDHARFSADVVVDDDFTFLLFTGEQDDVDNDLARHWRVMATRAWLDGATQFETPGFGHLDNWDGDWSFVSGLNTNVTAGATWTNRGLAPVVDQPPFGNKPMRPEDDGLEIIQMAGDFAEITP